MNIGLEIVKILNGVVNEHKENDFTLEKNFCDVFVRGNNYSKMDRQRLGKAMSKNARDKMIVKINSIDYFIEFNNMFNKCGKCGYKGNANIAHYKITKV